MSVKILCEIGINHNGDMNVVRKLIDVCSVAGVDYVKFQKRNPDKCVPENQKNVLKQTPWGDMRYIDYKYKIELTEKEIGKMQKDLSAILDYFDLLKSAPAPSRQGYGETKKANVFREDKVNEQEREIVGKIIEASPDKKDGYIKVKTIL